MTDSPSSQTSPEHAPDAARASRAAALGSAAVVVGLVGIVAALAGGSPVWVQPRDGPVHYPAIFTNVTIAAVFGLIAVALAARLLQRADSRESGNGPLRRGAIRSGLLFAGGARARTPGPETKRASMWQRVLPAASVVLAIAALLAIMTTLGDRAPAIAEDEEGRLFEPTDRRGGLFGFSDDRQTPVVEGGGVADSPPVASEAERTAVPPHLRLIAVAALIALVAAAWYRVRAMRRGARFDASDTNTVQAAAHRSVVGTIDGMLADPDPNTAIIGAYARLLEGLEAAGIGRLDHEGPMEHLRRALTRLHVSPEPLRRLIGLFQIARFSSHRLTTLHRDEALDALRAVAADLG